jgi:predicted dienelactone hydrolase
MFNLQMPHHRFPTPAAILLALLLASAAASAYQPPTPSLPVASIRYTWHDTARDRDVPVKIYYPATGAGPFPIIIFSHGLGGNREGYEYHGNH